MSNTRLLMKGLNGHRSYSSLSLMTRRLRNIISNGEPEVSCNVVNHLRPGGNRVDQLYPYLYNQRRYYAKRGIVKEKKGKGVNYEMSDDELSKVIPVEEFDAFLEAVHTKLKTEFSTQLSLRTGLGVETIPVELDGSEYPIKDLAQISRKSSSLMVLNLSALPDAIKPVLTALNASGMNLSPQIDGTKIFLTLPKVTREHRENLVKGAKTLLNAAKQEINLIQNQFIDKAKQPKSGISQEMVRDATDNIRARSQEVVRKCDELFKAKTKELLDD